MSYRFWCFTEYDNEKVQNYEEWFNRLFNSEAGIDYICGQRERCPNTGRLHIQGYVVFTRKKRLNGAKEGLDSTGVHLERRMGTHRQAVEYCQKEESRDGEFIELGEYDDRGSQTKCMEEIKKRIREGDSELDIAEEYFGIWCRYNKAFSKYRAMVQPGRDFKTIVRVYWGRSGVGKSRRATYECGPDVYRKPLGEWWDGYNGTSNIIIDDFYGWLRFDELLRCLDRYKHSVPIKGGFVNFAPELLIITSNVEPREWYNREKISDFRFDALVRRLDVVELMEDDWIEP
ncbi:putative Rep protein [Circo-like virus-Brazil hs2]|nr:putative Rep protein [Circo-like virus-Brazil hs2]